MKRAILCVVMSLMLIPVAVASAGLPSGQASTMTHAVPYGEDILSPAATPIILYKAPGQITQRTNAAAIRICHVAQDSRHLVDGKGETLLQLFRKVVPGGHADRYEILQVTRIPYGASPGKAVIWFQYVERQKINWSMHKAGSPDMESGQPRH